MRSIGLILCCGLLAGAATPAAAKPAYVASTVNLRAAPNTTSDVLGKISGGSLVDADNCTDSWCAVTWQEKRGFAIQTSLDFSGRVPTRRSAAPAPPRSGVVVEDDAPVYYEGGPPPSYYYYGGPYYRPYSYGYYYRPYRHYRRW
jgi:uncharacterized protein YraI